MTGPEIVLFQPDIPGNTGTILRTCACLGLPLHIIEPAGFRLDDKSLMRAGMDYVELALLTRHDDFEAFEKWRREAGRRMVLITTKTEKVYSDFDFLPHDLLLFGRESAGVSQNVVDASDVQLTIPMVENARSLNLAVSVAMVAGEAIRRLR